MCTSDCYLLLLDVFRAFDRVEYVKLFHILRNRNRMSHINKIDYVHAC